MCKRNFDISVHICRFHNFLSEENILAEKKKYQDYMKLGN